MAEKQVVPKDIQDEADRLYPEKENIFYGMNFDTSASERNAYIAGAINERAKGIWTDNQVIEIKSKQ